MTAVLSRSGAPLRLFTLFDDNDNENIEHGIHGFVAGDVGFLFVRTWVL